MAKKKNLLRALRGKSTELEVIELIKSGVDLTERTKDGRTVLHLAIEKRYPNAAIELIKAGAEINVFGGKFRYAPLHAAALFNAESVAEALLSAGIDANITANYGWTPLHAASRDGHAEVARLLIRNGAAINSTKEDGWAPIHLAAWNNRSGVLKALLESGASIDIKNLEGNTPLALALEAANIDAIEILISAGADIFALKKFNFSKAAANTRINRLVWKYMNDGLIDSPYKRQAFMNKLRQCVRDRYYWPLQGLKNLPEDFIMWAMLESRGEVAGFIETT